MRWPNDGRAFTGYRPDLDFRGTIPDEKSSKDRDDPVT